MSEAVLLGGVDVFHLVNDRHMRSRGLAGNHCAYVLELDGRLDIGRLQARLENAVRAVPELSWRLAGGFPLRPRWELRGDRSVPPVGFHEVESAHVPVTTIERLLALRVDGERPWAFDVVRRFGVREGAAPAGPRDAVVFRWFHSLVDGKGAERLVRWLGSGSGDAPDAPPPPEERFWTSERSIARLDRPARMAAMRAYNAHMMELGRTPILSLASAAEGPVPRRRPGETRIVRVHLSADETRAFDERVRRVAKLAETSVMVLAAARVVDRAFLARRLAPSQYVVPVPLSLDPKVGAGRMLGNHLTMMMFALSRDDLVHDNEARAIARLAEQQRAIVRQKLDAGMLAALDFARWLPSRHYHWLTTRPFGGEMASFIFSNPGAAAIESFAGVPVTDAYPVPAVVLPPGLEIVFTRSFGRVSGWIGYVEGVVEEGEAARMGDELRAELLGAARKPV